MSKPGTRRFIGPLTPAQQRRRERAQDEYRNAAIIADARCCSFREALKILHNPPYFYYGYATGEYP